MLIVSLEDDADELRRRTLAAMLRHKIDRSGPEGLAVPGRAGGGRGQADDARQEGPDRAWQDWPTRSNPASSARRVDVVSLDPFVKAHSVEENSNSAIDDVIQILTDLAATHDNVRPVLRAPTILPRARPIRAMPVGAAPAP